MLRRRHLRRARRGESLGRQRGVVEGRRGGSEVAQDGPRLLRRKRSRRRREGRRGLQERRRRRIDHPHRSRQVLGWLLDVLHERAHRDDDTDSDGGVRGVDAVGEPAREREGLRGRIDVVPIGLLGGAVGSVTDEGPAVGLPLAVQRSGECHGGIGQVDADDDEDAAGEHQRGVDPKVGIGWRHAQDRHTTDDVPAPAQRGECRPDVVGYAGGPCGKPDDSHVVSPSPPGLLCVYNRVHSRSPGGMRTT